LRESFAEYKKWNDLSTSVLSQGALAIYITNGMFDKNIKKIKTLYTERMSYLKKLTEHLSNSNIKWYIPKSGFFASFEVDRVIKTEDLIKNLEQKNIRLLDASSFYLNNYRDMKIMRLSISSVTNDKIKYGIYGISDCVKYM